MMRRVVRSWAGVSPKLISIFILGCTAMGWGTWAGDRVAPPRFLGLSLVDALQQLESEGLRIIYSSEFVRPEMKVTAEPLSSRPRKILNELLIPHGLASRRGSAGILIIVKAPARGAVKGQIRDRLDSRPLPGVQILVRGMENETETDTNGGFEITSLPPGSYSLEAVFPAYFPEKVEGVLVAAGRTVEVRMDLTPMAVYSEEVLVSPDDSSIRRNDPVARDHLSYGEIEALPKIGGDLFRAFIRVPGLAHSDESAHFNIRGGAESEVLIVLDGMELYEPFHLKERGGLFSIIDLRAVGGVDYLTGGFPAEYGGRMSGVIDVASLVPSGRRRTGLAVSSDHWGLLSEGAFHDGRGQWLVSARKGNPKEILNGLGADPSYNPRYFDIFGKVGYGLGRETTLVFNLLAAFDEVEGPKDSFVKTLEEPGTFQSRYSNEYAWLNLNRIWTSKLYSQITLSLGRLSQKRGGSNPVTARVEDERSTGILGLKPNWIFQTGRQLWKWGFDVKQLQAEYRYINIGETSDPASFGEGSGISGVRKVLQSPSGNEFAVYVADSIRLLPSLSFELGTRWEKQTYTTGKESRISPRVNIVYKPGARSVLRAGWGYFYQPERINELQVEDGVDEFFSPQRSEHRLISFEQELGSGFELQVSAYQRKISDLQPRYENLFDPFGFFPESDPDRVRIDPSRAEARGIEFVLRNPGDKKLNWWAFYTQASVEDEILGQMVPRSWDQRHTFGWGLSYRMAGKWNFNLAGNYHSGRPVTPVTVEFRGLPDGSMDVIPVIGNRNSKRFPPFHRVDFRVSRSLNLDRMDFKFFLDVTNVYNRKNVCCVNEFEFSPQGDGYAVIERTERHGLPRLLSFGITWTF